MRWNSSTTRSATLGSTWSGSANRLQNWRATRARPRLWGSSPSSGRISRTTGCQSRLTKATAGESSASPATRSGARSPTSMATRPPIELPTRCARPTSRASITSTTVSANQRAEYGAGDRLRRSAEARQVERVDPVARARERRGGVEERGLGGAQAVDADHVGAVAHGQRRHPPARKRDVMDAQQRRAPVGQAEHALEADGQVDVAAGVELALPEGLDARQLAFAQGQPRLRRRCR